MAAIITAIVIATPIIIKKMINNAKPIHRGKVIIHQDHTTVPVTFKHKNTTNNKNNPISQVI